MRLLNDRAPDHPVLLHGLHTFASWGNRLAFERASITSATPNPPGGEIRKDQRGQPGILLNSATRLVERAIPPATDAQVEARVAAALDALAAAGYVYVQDAGAGPAFMKRSTSEAPSAAASGGRHARGARPELLDEWLKRGPDTDDIDHVVVRSVKRSTTVRWDRVARTPRGLQRSSRPPRHRRGRLRVRRGAAGADGESGIPARRSRDRRPANRETLDLFERLAKGARPRIEHAQVVNPDDMPRFASLGVIASMQPSHAVEDMPWAETRIGPGRITGAYAWRSLRRAGAQLAFNSDLPATDYSIFYGLHSAITRQDKHGQPSAGWRTAENMTIEEAIRGWTTWAARATFQEMKTVCWRPVGARISP